ERKESSEAECVVHTICGRVDVSDHVGFPDTHHGPAVGAQTLGHLAIALHIALDLRHPPLGPVGEHRGKVWESAKAPRVAVPHVAVDEYGQPTSSDDDIRRTEHILCVQAITQA